MSSSVSLHQLLCSLVFVLSFFVGQHWRYCLSSLSMIIKVLTNLKSVRTNDTQQSVIHKRIFHLSNCSTPHYQMANRDRLVASKAKTLDSDITEAFPSLTWSPCLSFYLYNLRRWRRWSLRKFLVLELYNSTSVENVMGVPEASLPFHVEDENLPKKTSSLWKRKGSSHLSSLAAPDSATSAGCCLVTSSNNLYPQLQAAAQAQAEVCGHESPTGTARNWNDTAKGNLPSITAFLRTDFFPKKKMPLVVYENIVLYFLLNSWLQKWILILQLEKSRFRF